MTQIPDFQCIIASVCLKQQNEFQDGRQLVYSIRTFSDLSFRGRDNTKTIFSS